MTLLRSMFILICLLLSSCSIGTQLSTRYQEEPDVSQQKFHLLLVGKETSHDVETVAVLDKVDDKYEFLSGGGIFPHNYHQNLNGEEAFSKGRKFLEQLVILYKIEAYSILSPEGEIIGYELRPYFNPSQVNNAYYQSTYLLKKDNTVKFYVLWHDFYKPFVEEPN